MTHSSHTLELCITTVTPRLCGVMSHGDDADSWVSMGNTNHNDCWRVASGFSEPFYRAPELEGESNLYSCN